MSVIVKGMKMPNSCFSCEGCDGNKQYGYYCGLMQDAKDLEGINPSTQKPNWCPLIEIPTPHGRLIDERELRRLIKNSCHTVLTNELIDQCKTIVEAEE